MPAHKGDSEKPRRDADTEKLLRQFLNTDGPKGTTRSYATGWVRMFGKKTGQHAGFKAPNEDVCDDAYCWCQPGTDANGSPVP